LLLGRLVKLAGLLAEPLLQVSRRWATAKTALGAARPALAALPPSRGTPFHKRPYEFGPILSAQTSSLIEGESQSVGASMMSEGVSANCNARR